MQIRAAVLEEFGAPLVVREVELAEPRAGEVLVRLVACGVCHTDLYTASGADPSGYAPTVLPPRSLRCSRPQSSSRQIASGCLHFANPVLFGDSSNWERDAHRRH